MGLIDFIVTPFYLIVIYSIALWIRNTRYKEDPAGKFFLPGLTVKIIGALGLGLIYYYYYGGGSAAGDTYSYFYGGVSWVEWLQYDMKGALAFLFNPVDPESATMLRSLNPEPNTNYIFRGTAEILMIKLTGIINLLTLNSYYASALLFAFISFSGVWALYRTFIHFFPNISGRLAIAVLFIPSVFFWGSGILKDTVIIGCVGWLTYMVFRLFIQGNWSIPGVFVLIIAFWIILVMKGYILLAFAPALAFWILATYKSKIKSEFLRKISTPFLLILTVLVAALIIGQISDMLGRYSLEELEYTARATQNWHHMTNPEGAVYSLGIEDFTLGTMITSFPAAVNVTFFRPYLWEANGAVALLTAFESMAILLFAITILIKTRIIGIFRYMNHPFIQFCVVFALIFGFSVGLTSYNFGALARYKIQAMPFFVGALFMIWHQMKTANTKNKEGEIENERETDNQEALSPVNS